MWDSSFCWTVPPPLSLLYGCCYEERKRGKNLSVLSSGFLLGKRRLEGRGMVSKKEEVVSLPRGNLLQTVTGHYNNLAAQKSFWGGKLGGNRTGVNNLQHADPEVGRCAWEEGREEDSRGSIWHKNVKKRSFSCRLKLTLAVQNRAVYYCRLEQCYRKDKKGWETE